VPVLGEAGLLRSSLSGPVRRTPCTVEVRTAAGYARVTTHIFRKTVTILMDHAGLSSRAAADLLGHADISMTTDVHVGRKVATAPAPRQSSKHSPAPEQDGDADPWRLWTGVGTRHHQHIAARWTHCSTPRIRCHPPDACRGTRPDQVDADRAVQPDDLPRTVCSRRGVS